jgi:hypothetical protein
MRRSAELEAAVAITRASMWFSEVTGPMWPAASKPALPETAVSGGMWPQLTEEPLISGNGLGALLQASAEQLRAVDPGLSRM